MHCREKLEALVKSKIGAEAFSVERIHFVKTDRMHSPKKVMPFKYFPGKLPVLVSAPHAVRHMRQKKIKPSDEFTGSMAYLLNSLLNCHSLSVTKLYGGDPNFDSTCIYKEYIKTISQEFKLKLVIDLHGASRVHDFDLDIGTMNGTSLLGKEKYGQLLKKHLGAYGINNISENHFTVSGQETVTAFVSGVLNIPTIQLEINKRFRAPHQNPGDYCRLLCALSEFIRELP